MASAGLFIYLTAKAHAKNCQLKASIVHGSVRCSMKGFVKDIFGYKILSFTLEKVFKNIFCVYYLKKYVLS